MLRFLWRGGCGGQIAEGGKTHAVCCQIGYVVVSLQPNGTVHKSLGRISLKTKKDGTFERQFSNLLPLTGVLFQLALWCKFSVSNMHMYWQHF